MDWSTYLPMQSIAAWHSFEPGISGNNIVFDRSGNNRHISCDPANSPYLVGNILVDQPGWYFDGTRNPLVFNGNLQVKHLFFVATVSTPLFVLHEGLLTAPTGMPLLIGAGAGTNRIWNLFNAAGISNYSYFKSDVSFAPNNQLAPMGNLFAVMELILPDGVDLNGIQIGQERANTAMKFNGFFVENQMYSTVLNKDQRRRIYDYFALRYHLWRKLSDGLNIYPFDPAHPVKVTPIEKMLQSESVSGATTSRSKGSTKRLFDLDFPLSNQYELEAAVKFCNSHRDENQECYFQDKTVSPERLIKCKVNSRVKYDSVPINQFDYSIQLKES